MTGSPSSLPICHVLPTLATALAEHPSVVLSSPPGSGKTTGVPPFLLTQDWLGTRCILMLEPRRLAARAAARRMASQMNEIVGGIVGYQTRLDSKVSARTRIQVVTEGILTRRLQLDPELADVGIIIFDEFHERSLQADLGLALSLDVQSGLRDDLRLLVMSATLDTAKVCGLLGNAPLVESQGESYPVEIHYCPPVGTRPAHQQWLNFVLKVLQQTEGDVLVFLPGAGEIMSTARGLHELAERSGWVVCPLFGNLSREAQDQAILPDKQHRRRIVLATSIAETSLTIEGITTVIDAGWSRRPGFDPNTGLTRLNTVRLAKSEADQRAGRAGRTGPGTCYRFWSESEQDRLIATAPAEILQADLASFATELALWGVSDPQKLLWLDAPPKGAYAQAVELLQSLDAIDSKGRLTSAGRNMAGLPVHPRLAHMIVLAASYGEAKMACDLSALLTEPDILRRKPGVSHETDLLVRLDSLCAWRDGVKLESNIAVHEVDRKMCRRVDEISRRLYKRMAKIPQITTAKLSPGAMLALAYPDRIGQRRSNQSGRYLLSSGRGVWLDESDVMNTHDYLVAVHLDARKKEGRVFLAAEIVVDELETLLADHICTQDVIAWDDRTDAVEVKQTRQLGALVLSSQRLAKPDSAAVIDALVLGIKTKGLECLPWSADSRAWQLRIESVRDWQPKADWPDMSDEALLETLADWLAPYLEGMTRLVHLQRLNLKEILLNRLDWQQQTELEKLAPSHIQVPSGSRKRLSYAPGQAPILEVRLQEMFGLKQTPCVCNGRIPVMLHLLSPAQRPIQVTQDLEGFWDRTYQEVKKELKGRYPKHYWPDDPWAAVPTARTKKRMRK